MPTELVPCAMVGFRSCPSSAMFCTSPIKLEKFLILNEPAFRWAALQINGLTDILKKIFRLETVIVYGL